MAGARGFAELGAASPSASFVHGSAFAFGQADASASLRRGFDLSADVMFAGRLAVALGGDELSAALNGNAEARAGVALQAFFPVDLFDLTPRAGLVARFRAQAALSASIAANAQLHGAAFERLVRDRVRGTLFASLLEVFLEETAFEVGVWARAAFAAEIYGELIVAGSLLPSGGQGAGFSVRGAYGAGLGAAAGWDVVANHRFPDPARLFERTADVATDAVLDAADRYIATLSGEKRRRAAAARPLLALLLPLATRSLYRLGVELASSDGGAAARQAVVRTFLRTAREQALRSLADLAIDELARLLRDTSIGAWLDGLDAPTRADVIKELRALRAELQALSQLSASADLNAWLLALLTVLDRAHSLASGNLLPPPLRDDVQDVVARLWATGVLVHHVVTAARAGTAEFTGGALPAELVRAPAATVLKALGTPGPLSYADLVRYVVGIDLTDAVRSATAAADAMRWLGAAVGRKPEEVLAALLGDLLEPNNAAAKRLTGTIATALTAALHDQLVPDLLEPLQARQKNELLGRLIDEVVAPTIVTLPDVVLPRLAQRLDADAVRRLRETVSAVLLLSIANSLIVTTDVLLDHALTESEQALRSLGREVARLGDESPALALVASVAAGSVLPFMPLAKDVEGILDLAADIVKVSNGELRAPALDAVSIALALGLGLEETRDKSLEVLAGSDAAPRRQDLDAALGQLQDGAWEVATIAVPGGLLLIAKHYWHLVVAFAKAITQAAKAVVDAAVAAAEWVYGQLTELARRLGELAKAIAAALDRIAVWIGELAAHLRQQIGAGVDAIRHAGLDLLTPILDGLPDFVKDGAIAIYNALFDAVKWLLELPARILENVAGWVHEILTARLDVPSFDADVIRAEVRRRILESGVADVYFGIHIEIPDVDLPGTWFDVDTPDIDVGFTLPQGTIASTLADLVIGDATFDRLVEATATEAVTAQRDRAEEAVLRARHDQLLSDQEATAEAALLVPANPPVVRFVSPGDRSVHSGAATVQFRIDNANETFVKTTLGVPPRVAVYVNGRQYTIPRESWNIVSSGLTCTMRVRLAPTVRSIAQPPRLGTLKPMTARQAVASDGAGGTKAIINGLAVTDSGRPTLRSPVELGEIATAATDADGAAVVNGVPGLNLIGVAVGDGAGHSDAKSLSISLAVPMRIEITPSVIPLDTPVTVTVEAFDVVTNKRIRKGARVVVEGEEIGRVGRPFEHTFKAVPVRLSIPGLLRPMEPGRPVLKPLPGTPHLPKITPQNVAWDALLRNPVKSRAPTGVVNAPGYAQTPIPWTFVPAPPTHDALFVSQSVPEQLAPEATAPVRVRMRNTGTFTWKSAEQYRLGSIAPQDNTNWGLHRVELARDTPPGDEAEFAFTITAPTAPGSIACRWQMVQDGVKWFGDSSPVTKVRVGEAPPACLQLAARRRMAVDLRNQYKAGGGLGMTPAELQRRLAALEQEIARIDVEMAALRC